MKKAKIKVLVIVTHFISIVTHFAKKITYKFFFFSMPSVCPVNLDLLE